MGILDSIVEWIATQIMNLLDLVTGSILGALGCDMSTFLRYFPAAETLYEVFVAISIGFILLNFVWQLFKNYGAGVGLSAEDPVKLALRSFLFLFLALFSDEIMTLLLDVAGTPYAWIACNRLCQFWECAHSHYRLLGIRFRQFDRPHLGCDCGLELHQTPL